MSSLRKNAWLILSTISMVSGTAVLLLDSPFVTTAYSTTSIFELTDPATHCCCGGVLIQSTCDAVDDEVESGSGETVEPQYPPDE